MRYLGVALALLTLVGERAEAQPGSWYRIGVTRLAVAAQHAGRPWDDPHAPQKDVLSCCRPKTVPDGTDPDLGVTLTVGSQRMSTRPHFDQIKTSFEDYAFVTISDGEPVTVEVWDQDGPDRQPIGKTEVRLSAEGRPPGVLHFGEVLELELAVEPVKEPRLVLVLDADGNPEQETTLWLLEGQKVRVTASGQMCVRKTCVGAEAAPSSKLGKAGQLSLRFGDDAHEQLATYHPGVLLQAGSTGRLRLGYEPAFDDPLVGKYNVELHFE